MALRPLRDDEVIQFGGIKFRRAHLYADEMVEDEAIEFLRNNKVNVQTARELGYAGRGDGFHVSYARRTKRFLFTKDRDFLNDRRFPLNNIPGIIVVKADMTRGPALNATPCPPLARASRRRDVGVAVMCSRF